MSFASAGADPSGSQSILAVVTVDGPVGVGKSVLARRLADRLNAAGSCDWFALDTGAMYRAVALKALQKDVALDDSRSLAGLATGIDLKFEPSEDGERVFADERDVTAQLRQPEVAAATARVARHESVRAAMIERQRQFGERGQIVAEGRDQGTVVFPQAAMKFYLTASTAERTERRRLQMQAQGQQVPESLLSQVQERDALDRRRTAGALRVAADACVIDTTSFSEDFVLNLMAELARVALQGVAA